MVFSWQFGGRVAVDGTVPAVVAFLHGFDDERTAPSACLCAGTAALVAATDVVVGAGE
jgi:putative intracellular protease/amidase